jgi:hypothetical protein
MAGDWIKFENATLDKPEVFRIADLLGVTPEHAVGLLCRFWVWLDRNSCNGLVTLMYAKSIDAVMRCDGFASCLVDVGWAEIDNSKGVLTIRNFDRHNGKSAKTRASTKDRVANHRNAHVTPQPLPEKRREEVIKNSTYRRATVLPERFAVSERVLKWAAEKGHDHLDAHFEHFIGQARAKGYTYVDWDDALMNAIRKDWAGLRTPKPQATKGKDFGQRRIDTVSALTGRNVIELPADALDRKVV